MLSDPHQSDAVDPIQADPIQAEAAPGSDRLVAALAEIERHVGRLGWDQPARLFALVPTADLLRAEPHLAGQLPETSADALSSIEQDEFHEGEDLQASLERIQWSQAVLGCALAVERSFLPTGFEADLPDDPADAAQVVAQHPRRQDLRVVVGVLRDGTSHGIGRLKTSPDDLFGSPDLVPGLAALLTGTLQ